MRKIFKSFSHNKIRLIDVFGLADQVKIDPVQIIPHFKRNESNNVNFRDSAVAQGKVVIKEISWCV